MILVTGATGTVGTQVVRELLRRGARVRAFVRDADRARDRFGEGVELALGDFGDEASVRAAMDGAERLLLSCADDPRRTDWERRAMALAADCGVEWVVRLSTIGARPGAPVAFWDWHGRLDEHLRASGLPHVVLRSSFYMSNLLAAAETVARDGTLFAPAGDARIATVHPGDVGAAAAAALTGAGEAGRTYTITGPQALTYAQMAQALSQAIGRPVRYVDVPDEEARRAMVESGLPEPVAAVLVTMFGELRRGAASAVTADVELLTGAPARPFVRFAEESARLFEPVAA